MDGDPTPAARAKYEKLASWNESGLAADLAYVRRWTELRFSQRHFRDNPVPKVRAVIERPVANNGRELVGALLKLVWWYEHHGIRLILEGDPGGWPTFATAWKIIELMTWLEARIHTAPVRKLLGMSPPSANSVPGACYLFYSSHEYASAALLSFIATGDREAVAMMARHLHQAAAHFQWGIDPLNIFMARKLLGEPTDGSYHQQNHFQDSIKAMEQWEVEGGNVEQLIWARLGRLKHEGFRPGTDERYFPCAFMAVAAISRVRRLEGRACLVPDHPLLRTPLTQVPERIDHALPDWYTPLADTLHKLD